MKKHEGYQKVYTSNTFTWLKSLFKKNGSKSLVERLYYQTSRVSIRKLQFIPNLKTAKFILDIGSGSGNTLIFIKKYINPNAKLYGVDLEKSLELSIDEKWLSLQDVQFSYFRIF